MGRFVQLLHGDASTTMSACQDQDDELVDIYELATS